MHTWNLTLQEAVLAGHHFEFDELSLRGHHFGVGVPSLRGWHSRILPVGCYLGKSTEESGGRGPLPQTKWDLTQARSTPVPKHSLLRETQSRKKEGALLFRSQSLEGLSTQTPILLRGHHNSASVRMPPDSTAGYRPREEG